MMFRVPRTTTLIASPDALFLPSIGGEEEMYGGIIQVSAAAEVRINHLPDLCAPIWEVPQLDIYLLRI